MSACRNVSRLPRGRPARAGGRGAISAPPLSPDPGQVESVHHWLLTEGSSGWWSEPFCTRPLLPGFKSTQGTAPPLLPPRWPMPPAGGQQVSSCPAGGGVLAPSGQVDRDGLVLHPTGSLLRSCVQAVSMPCRVWYQQFQLWSIGSMASSKVVL